MALLHPAQLPHVKHTAGLYRELDVLERLQTSLPDGYDIFHSVALHNVHEGTDRHGEIDVVVVGPAGNLLLVEIKAGDVLLRDGDIYKLYGNGEHDVGRQVRIQYVAMMSRLAEAGLSPSVTNCLVLPDFLVGETRIVALPRERIIDADDFAQLGTRVREFLAANPRGCDRDALCSFLKNEFCITTDVSVIGAQLRDTVRQLADGMATWVSRIVAPSRCVRVQATAGSGKTQLALTLLEQAAARSAAGRYVCYNRALADHIARIAPARAHVSTFHETCIEHYRRTRGEPDFTRAGLFSEATTVYLEDSDALPARFDVLVIDEAQDFEPEWLQSLISQLKPDGLLYLLEDDDQRLYARDGFELPDAVVLRCRDNYRSPQAICSVLNALRLPSAPIHARSPFYGTLPEFRVYDDARSLDAETRLAVDDLLLRGFTLDEIVILSGHGQSKSMLLGSDRLGPYRIRKFTGQYDRGGSPVWTEGELTVESVYRYKGQSAPAVILTELDFADLGGFERAKLFVGMTRAQMALQLVLSRHAEACLAKILSV
jgi:superfamily I DNA/RNA helicase